MIVSHKITGALKSMAKACFFKFRRSFLLSHGMEGEEGERMIAIVPLDNYSVTACGCPKYHYLDGKIIMGNIDCRNGDLWRREHN
jgi:hypothetical protein